MKSTEILKEKKDGTWKVTKGPDLPKPLFGHCVEILQGGNVLLSGGFDGEDQSDITAEFHWKENPPHLTGKWSIRSPMKSHRYDHGCYSHKGTIHVTGGWKANITPKLKTERYNETTRKWEDAKMEMDNGLPDILRSFTVGISDGKLALIGGVRFEVRSDLPNGKKATKHSEVYELGSLGWEKSANHVQIPRSSHVGINVPASIDYSCEISP